MKESELKALLDAYNIPHKHWKESKFNDLIRTVSRGDGKLDVANGKLGLVSACVGIRILYQRSKSDYLVLKQISTIPRWLRPIMDAQNISLLKERLSQEQDFDVIADLMRHAVNIIANKSQFKKVEKHKQEHSNTEYMGMVEIYDIQVYECELSEHLYKNFDHNQELHFKWEQYVKVCK